MPDEERSKILERIDREIQLVEKESRRQEIIETIGLVAAVVIMAFIVWAVVSTTSEEYNNVPHIAPIDSIQTPPARPCVPEVSSGPVDRSSRT